jgi:serine acetyltransferase
MLLVYYVVMLLCYRNVMLLRHYVVVLLCYQGITLLQYHNRAYFTHTDYQYITTFIKQRIQLYYNNLHTII